MHNKVLIIGAGPSGLCLSLALAARGMQVEIIEKQSTAALAAPAYDGREVALTHASMRLLRELGVWQHLPADAAVPLRQARIMDDANPGFEVRADSVGHARLGMFVSNHHIRAAAWRAVAETTAIQVHAGVAVESVHSDPDAAHARLADGRTLDAALLVAADSRFSRTRQAMGIATHMHDFGLTMLLCRVRHTEPVHGTAWEWFGSGQTRALLPLGEHLSSAVLTLPAAAVTTLLSLPDAEFADAVAERYEGRLGTVEVASTRHAHPLVATWARRFVGTRFALVGDAAVGMHPVTAHGFNLALTSVEHLARATAEGLARDADAGLASALASYQRRHRLSSAPLFFGTQMVAGLFTDPRPHATLARRAILAAGRRHRPLPRLLASHLVEESAPSPSPLRHARLALKVLKPRLGAGRFA